MGSEKGGRKMKWWRKFKCPYCGRLPDDHTYGGCNELGCSHTLYSLHKLYNENRKKGKQKK